MLRPEPPDEVPLRRHEFDDVARRPVRQRPGHFPVQRFVAEDHVVEFFFRFIVVGRPDVAAPVAVPVPALRRHEQFAGSEELRRV